jgi:hypothetical protein
MPYHPIDTISEGASGFNAHIVLRERPSDLRRFHSLAVGDDHQALSGTSPVFDLNRFLSIYTDEFYGTLSEIFVGMVQRREGEAPAFEKQDCRSCSRSRATSI